MDRRLTDKEKECWHAVARAADPVVSATRQQPRPVIPARRAMPQPAALSVQLDLHGMRLHEAFGAVEEFLQQHAAMGTRRVTIITGKGKGNPQSLEREVPLWLESRRWLAQIRRVSPAQQGGALMVYLKTQKSSE